ncbi:MAG: leucine-rich repeat domain-containing protein [Holosporaceae bacterium]|nr:leucine-rich repeat domain-containing protein [Holosporaceae bacterium]
MTTQLTWTNAKEHPKTVVFEPGFDPTFVHLGERSEASESHVWIPGTVARLRGGGFGNRRNLWSVRFEVGSSLASIPEGCFQSSPLTSFVLPREVAALRPNCFRRCQSLADFAFEQGSRLRSIGDSAFAFSGVVSLTLPAAVMTVEAMAFHGCETLTNLEFEPLSALTTLGAQAFAHACSLRVFHVPPGVTFIGQDCFGRCAALTEITFADRATGHQAVDQSGRMLIGDGAFSGTAIAWLELPAHAAQNGEGQIARCASLTVVTYATDREGRREPWNDTLARSDRWRLRGVLGPEQSGAGN